MLLAAFIAGFLHHPKAPVVSLHVIIGALDIFPREEGDHLFKEFFFQLLQPSSWRGTLHGNTRLEILLWSFRDKLPFVTFVWELFGWGFTKTFFVGFSFVLWPLSVSRVARDDGLHGNL